MKKGLKKPWLTRLLLLNSKGAIFTAENIYTRHLKFGIKYSVNGKQKTKKQLSPRVRLKAEKGHQILTKFTRLNSLRGVLPLKGLFDYKYFAYEINDLVLLQC